MLWGKGNSEEKETGKRRERKQVDGMRQNSLSLLNGDEEHKEKRKRKEERGKKG